MNFRKKIEQILKSIDNSNKKDNNPDSQDFENNLINKLILINENLDNLLKNKTKEFEDLNKRLEEKEQELIKKNKTLACKEKLLAIQDQELLSKEKELTRYINKLFEQQERERIVKWLVNCIRESLDLEKVLSTITEEVGKLLKVDRCLISLFNPDTLIFELQSEYIQGEDISSVIEDETIQNIPNKWHNDLVNNNNPIAINNINLLSLSDSQKNYFKLYKIKSIAITPLFHKKELLGLITVHQVKSQREWKTSHIEILKDIGSQIAIAIKQAELYSTTKKQAERENLLSNIISTVRSTLDIEKVKISLVNEVGKAFNADRCFIRLFNQSNNFLPVDSEYLSSNKISSIKNYVFNLDLNDYVKLFLNKNHPLIITDSASIINSSDSEKILKDYCNNLNIKSSYVFPIINDDNLIGSFIIQYVQRKVELHADEIELLQTIANQAGVGIRQANLYTQVQQATKLKSEFLANMSHEFRTPLNAIIGFSEMLISGNYGQLTEKQKEYLNNIVISGKHLLNLVNDVLDLSKIESGNMELYFETFDSIDLIKETVSILESMAKKKRINIKLNLVPAQLNADGRRFRQIMYNLLSNAIKFTEENGQITINTTITGKNLKVEVQDTGIGIADKDKDKIFQQFRQLDSSYSRKQEGTGLGLTLTKKLIELHKGEIDFESKIGKGTKFWFILPDARILKVSKK